MFVITWSLANPPMWARARLSRKKKKKTPFAYLAMCHCLEVEEELFQYREYGPVRWAGLPKWQRRVRANRELTNVGTGSLVISRNPRGCLKAAFCIFSVVPETIMRPIMTSRVSTQRHVPEAPRECLFLGRIRDVESAITGWSTFPPSCIVR